MLSDVMHVLLQTVLTFQNPRPSKPNQAYMTLQWIQAHCGIPGNEREDTLAKLGA